MAAATLVTPVTAPTACAQETDGGRAAVARLRARLATPLGGQLLRFAAIGAGSTGLNLGLLAALHETLGAQTANIVALALSTVVNTAANRTWTFRLRGGEGMARQHAQSMLVFALTWALSSAALALLAFFSPQPSTTATVAVVAVANAVSTVARFTAMRAWIFRPQSPQSSQSPQT